MYEHVGVIHIHTKDSDGTKTHADIIEYGKKLKLDFLMFSDHNTLKSLDLEGRYEGLNAIVGYELNDRNNQNHYLAFGTQVLPENRDEAIQYVNEVRRLNGLGIIAHPDEIRENPKYPAYPWTDWNVRNFDGVEIWNHMSSWMENAAKGNVLKYFLNPRSMLESPSDRILQKWDELAKRRRVLGIGSIDVHGLPFWLGPIRLTVFPYKVQMQTIRTHVLTFAPLSDDFKEAKKRLLDSLKQCKAFVSNLRWGDARGFRFWAKS
jgi:hypothetical protein